MSTLFSPLPVPPNPVPTPQSQYWPILCKGQANRIIFAGPPEIEAKWHVAMEQGRLLEGSLNDAMYAIQKQQLDLQRSIQSYSDLIQVCLDGRAPDGIRSGKLLYDAFTFVSRIHTLVTDIQGLTQAIQTNLQILQTIEAQAQSILQNNLNALANFMLQMCNLGFPPLPSIATLFGTNIFSFNGFALTSLIPRNVSFSQFTNFSFAQCTLTPPNTGIYDQPPVIINFDGYTVGGASGSIALPFHATALNPATTTQAQMQAITTQPIYNVTTLNAGNVLLGALPNPAQIISAYQLPSADYKANVISTVPALAALITTSAPTPAVQSEEAKLLVEYVSLSQIVASNYDKNLLATWLFYLQGARAGRAGQWLPSFQTSYNTFIQPSLNILTNPATTIPWNTVLGGTITLGAPADIALIDTIQGAASGVRQNILWKLSYIEASLLGYARTTQFDSGADNAFLSGFTSVDTDYASTQYDPTDTTTVILGADTASFPVQCTFPKAMATVLSEVILIATANIAGTPSFVTNRPQFRFTYDAFAVATQVDRFTQFWRTFNFNLQQLLAQDPYIVSQVISYPAALDSAIDPLGTSTDYQQITNDALTRVRSWVPGTPLLPIPQAPITDVGVLPGITGTATGWNSTNFDPNNFLGRPDIQSLPLSTQLAMLRTNESYAAVMTNQNVIQAQINQSRAQAKAALNTVQNNGFSVESTITQTVKTNAPNAALTFDKKDYDNTNYVTSPTLFTIQVTGLYVVSANVGWDKGSAGVRNLFLIQNGTIVLDSVSTQETDAGPINQTVGTIQQFNSGDTIQIQASQSTGTQQDILPGAGLSVLLVPASIAINQLNFGAAPGHDDFKERNLVADVNILSGGIAVSIQKDGGVIPVDPVGATSPPFVDGIAINAAVKSAQTSVGTIYGALYEITGANFVPGGLVYVAPGGVLTQNFTALVTEVNWVIVVGKAISPDVILFEPQLPTKTISF